MERATKLILKKNDQTSWVIQSNHLRFLNCLRLARMDMALYHILSILYRINSCITHSFPWQFIVSIPHWSERDNTEIQLSCCYRHVAMFTLFHFLCHIEKLRNFLPSLLECSGRYIYTQAWQGVTYLEFVLRRLRYVLALVFIMSRQSDIGNPIDTPDGKLLNYCVNIPEHWVFNFQKSISLEN